jgi:hypothetical protein
LILCWSVVDYWYRAHEAHKVGMMGLYFDKTISSDHCRSLMK